MDWVRVLPASLGRWIKSCWRGTNIWPRKTAILKAQLRGRPKLSDAGRATLGEMGHRLGRKPSTRHGASLPKNANTSLRLSSRTTTTLPSASTPWTWNAFFARVDHRLCRNALGEVATVARPDTLLAWYRKLVATYVAGHNLAPEVLLRKGLPTPPNRSSVAAAILDGKISHVPDMLADRAISMARKSVAARADRGSCARSSGSSFA